MDKEQKKWMFILIILILILLNVAIFINEIKLIKGEEDTTEVNNEAVVEEPKNEKAYLEKRIEKQEENVRVQYYIAGFLNLIENQNYEEAYKLLNEDFKNNNFETLEKFKEFCKIYPNKDTVCKYTDFDRIGASVYVMTTIINQLNATNYQPVKQIFVVRENDYNDYKISLQMDYSYVDSEGNVVE